MVYRDLPATNRSKLVVLAPPVTNGVYQHQGLPPRAERECHHCK
ncbi:Uncharacterised protein [Vibrio cholerae]|nr:Uncharacterised protein [Vibrio cholerae]